jgi:four helix bundle protein
MRSNAAYRKLETWQVSMDFVEQVYKTTRNFPREELYGLTSQLRRAVVSVPSNVAEGYCRRSTKVYVNHVSIALGSHAELETCIEIAARLGFVTDATRDMLEAHLASIGRLLYALHESLEEKVRLEEAKQASPRSPSPLS